MSVACFPGADVRINLFERPQFISTNFFFVPAADGFLSKYYHFLLIACVCHGCDCCTSHNNVPGARPCRGRVMQRPRRMLEPLSGWCKPIPYERHICQVVDKTRGPSTSAPETEDVVLDSTVRSLSCTRHRSLSSLSRRLEQRSDLQPILP